MFGSQKNGRGSWTMTLHLARPPYCPGCAQPLRPEVTCVQRDWAWCMPCAATLLSFKLDLERRECLPWIGAHLNVSHGVKFYVPRVAGPKIPSLIELEAADDRYDG